MGDTSGQGGGARTQNGGYIPLRPQKRAAGAQERMRESDGPPHRRKRPRRGLQEEAGAYVLVQRQLWGQGSEGSEGHTQGYTARCEWRAPALAGDERLIRVWPVAKVAAHAVTCLLACVGVKPLRQRRGAGRRAGGWRRSGAGNRQVCAQHLTASTARRSSRPPCTPLARLPSLRTGMPPSPKAPQPHARRSAPPPRAGPG